jgi:ABC-type lipoprotein release transport system permease subunit
MSAVWLIASVDLRRRWRELILLGLLVALASGATMAAVAAADRARTSVDRFLDWSQVSSAGFPLDVDEPDRLIEALVALPEVEAVAVSNTLTVFVADDPANPFAGTSLTVNAPDPIGADVTSAIGGVDVDRLLVLEGRLPHPDRAEEILLYEWIADMTGWDIGERLAGQTLAVADIDRLFGDGPFPGLNGPTLDLVVVGIGRSGPDVAGQVGDSSASAYGSERLVSTTRDEALWWGSDVAVRTTTGASEFDLLPALEAAGVAPRAGATFGGEFVGGVSDARAAAIATATNTVDTMAVGLLVFAAGVAAAGMIAVGQAVVRHVAGAANTQRTLLQLGQSRRETAVSVTVPVLAATIAGVTIGSVAAIAASAYLPTGLARRAEVDPGVWVRPELIVPIGAVTVVLAAGFCFLVALRRMRSASATATGLTAGALLARLDPPPAVETGVRMALDRGRGSRMLPTRSAMTAMTIGVVSIASAVVLADNVDELTSTPARWGWNWSSSPEYTGDDPADALTRVAADPDVEGFAAFAANGISVNGAVMGGFALEPLAGEVEFTIRDGRLPEAPGEVALGARTLRQLDVSLGDTVDLADFDGGHGRAVTVVGTAVFPYESAETIDDGAALLPETLFDVTDESTASIHYVMRYADGTDPAAVEAALAEEHGLVFNRFTSPHPPAQVRNISVTKQVAVALAVFFSLLGVLAVTHAVVVSSRRRRLDLAVLRTLGFVRRQVRVAFLAQSLVFGIVATVIGIPIGVLTGRLVWRAVTDELGAVTTPTAPWGAVLAIVPVVLVVSALLSWWPGRAASRRRPSEALRAE